jgi:prepilin-type N-terminal cleavage/methylation domain-containing protein
MLMWRCGRGSAKSTTAAAGLREKTDMRCEFTVSKIAKRAGFTLTEFLVVITIIGILSALLLPAIRNAWVAADETDVRNELMQIAVAYNNFTVAMSRGPQTQKELSPFYENSNRINEDLETGRITVIWGISAPDSHTILAYETSADRLGHRLVAMGDASVQTMDWQELKSTLRTTVK